jgi:ubiquinone/menaquinone biosynthesis C-methylase UbiE
MDYDKTEIPAAYDMGRDHGPKVIALWMSEIGRHVADRSIRTILDLGCGTGRFSNALADRFHAHLIGLDPSKKMLAQARLKMRNDRVSYGCGMGENLPLRDGTVDMVFMSMVFHHFSDYKQVALECRRVLRNPGLVIVRTGTSERIPLYPYVNFIPATVPLLKERMPALDFIRSVFRTAGFAHGEATIVVQEIAPTHSAYVDKLAAGGDSVLASLDQETLRGGLQALRAHAAGVDPRPVSEPIDVLVFSR